MQQTLKHETPEFNQPLTLSELIAAATAMLDAGAPRDAEVGMVTGDRGGQRDPDRFLRGIFVRWES